MANKKILLLCWEYPPNKGIGGRRWAKLSKYMAKAGYECHVIKSVNHSISQPSPWTKDIQSDKIKVYDIEPHFLMKWLSGNVTTLKKIKYLLAQKLLLLIYNGTIYDKAIGIEQKLIKLSQKIIDKHQIDFIIVTAAPFNLMYYTAQLLKNNPKLISLADFRDPWLTAVNYGMKQLSPARKKVEEEKQNLVLSNFNYISAPNTFLLEEIENSYTGKLPIKAQFIEIPHAFDIDDYNPNMNQPSTQSNSEKFQIVYGGAMYLGVENYIAQFSKAINDFEKQFPLKKIEVIFYTEDYKKFQSIYDNLIFKPSIGDEFLKEVAKADYILILLAEHNKDSKTTKYYEYMPLNKPYIYLGPKGFVSESIVVDHLGYVFSNNPNNLATIFDSKSTISEAKSEPITQHSFGNRVNILSQLFHK